MGLLGMIARLFQSKRVFVALFCAMGVVSPMSSAFAQSDGENAETALEKVEEAYRAGDFAAARAGLLPLAESGNAVAQYRLGHMIANSSGGAYSREEAIKWLEAARAQDYNAGEVLLARTYLTGNPEKSDYERAAELLTLGVENNDAEAAFYLGSLYRIGRGVPSDPEQAFRLLISSAEAGVPNAQFAVAQMYSRGEGITQDDAQSSRWLLTAADAGSGEAQLSLYFNYLRGSGFPQDEEKAAHWLNIAANTGVPLAQRMLGSTLLFEGKSDEDIKRGLDYLHSAARKGEAGAQSNLGFAFASGKGVEKDLEQAAAWYTLAAEQGLTRAALVMGDFYQSGQGVDQDMQKAARYYRIAFAGRDKIAAARLGSMILDGSLTEEDAGENAYDWIAATAETGDQEALAWLEKKALFEPYAHLRIGMIFSEGLGFDVDPERAAKHFGPAARAGLVIAQEAMAEALASGSGVEQDFIEAHKWANIAAFGGSDSAAERRDVLAQLMTADQIAEAQDRARKYIQSQ